MQGVGEQRQFGRIAIGIRNRQVEHGRIGVGQATLAHQAKLKQHLVQPLAGLLSHAAAALDRPAIALARPDQDVHQVRDPALDR